MNVLGTSSDKQTQYMQKKIYMLVMLLLVTGSMVWLLVGLGYFMDGRRTILARSIYILFGLAALAVVFQRDFYLPFLGPTHVPCAGLEDRQPPGGTLEVEVKVEPRAKVIYWAAEPASESLKTLATWKDAYAQYENTGVATADETGHAILRVRAPQPYSVPMKGRLDPHVHYRICAPAGWMGRVETVWIREGFQGMVEKLEF